MYFSRGDIHPAIAAPIALGVLAGARAGTRMMEHMRNTTIRKLFIPVLAIVAASMILRGLSVR